MYTAPVNIKRPDRMRGFEQTCHPPKPLGSVPIAPLEDASRMKTQRVPGVPVVEVKVCTIL